MRLPGHKSIGHMEKSWKRSAAPFPTLRIHSWLMHQMISDISAATDAAYYQVLLKLGVIRAPTYGERWDIWKATNCIPAQSAPNPRQSRATTRQTAEVRARVPFLASASSDLDDAFKEGETYDGDGESLIGQARPSPRKELVEGDQSRSLVGYTPSHSVDYDAITLNPPIRTSTPVYAQEQGYGRTTPPLPPYSVSGISGSLAEADSRLVDESHTPKANQATFTESKDELKEAVVREMERRADEFYGTGLTGRCWDVWHRAADWVFVSFW